MQPRYFSQITQVFAFSLGEVHGLGLTQGWARSTVDRSGRWRQPMSHDFSPAISALRTDLLRKEQEVRAIKQSINRLSILGGNDAPYPDADRENEETGSLGTMRRDLFYGVPLASAIRDYLKMRRSSGVGPATVNDIHAALTQGGFKFETKNEANAKRALYISLAKNAAVFHKLPGGSGDAAAVFGLTEWYPAARSEDGGSRLPGKVRKGKVKRRLRPVTPSKSKEGDDSEDEVEPEAEQTKAPPKAVMPIAKRTKMRLVNGKLVPVTNPNEGAQS